jgi:hypothetical protein
MLTFPKPVLICQHCAYSILVQQLQQELESTRTKLECALRECGVVASVRARLAAVDGKLKREKWEREVLLQRQQEVCQLLGGCLRLGEAAVLQLATDMVEVQDHPGVQGGGRAARELVAAAAKSMELLTEPMPPPPLTKMRRAPAQSMQQRFGMPLPAAGKQQDSTIEEVGEEEDEPFTSDGAAATAASSAVATATVDRLDVEYSGGSAAATILLAEP